MVFDIKCKNHHASFGTGMKCKAKKPFTSSVLEPNGGRTWDMMFSEEWVSRFQSFQMQHHVYWNPHLRFLWEPVSLDTKQENLKWRWFNAEFIEIGSLKLNTKWRRTLNQGTLIGSWLRFGILVPIPEDRNLTVRNVESFLLLATCRICLGLGHLVLQYAPGGGGLSGWSMKLNHLLSLSAKI